MALRSFVLILSLSVFASLAVVAAADGADAAGGDGGNRTEDKDVYDSKYDDIDLNELLKNDRLRRNYVKCLLDEGPCTPDGHELRSKRVVAHKIPLISLCEISKSISLSFDRFIARRHRNRLFEMHGETEGGLGHRHSLSHRQSTGGMGWTGKNLWQRWRIQTKIFGNENRWIGTARRRINGQWIKWKC